MIQPHVNYVDLHHSWRYPISAQIMHSLLNKNPLREAPTHQQSQHPTETTSIRAALRCLLYSRVKVNTENILQQDSICLQCKRVELTGSSRRKVFKGITGIVTISSADSTWVLLNSCSNA